MQTIAITKFRDNKRIFEYILYREELMKIMMNTIKKVLAPFLDFKHQSDFNQNSEN